MVSSIDAAAIPAAGDGFHRNYDKIATIGLAHARILRENDAEGIFQRLKVRLHRAPLPDSITVDRPPNLFLARGPNRAIIGVKMQARLFERQPQIVEQRPHFTFKIVDQPFVDHAVDSPR